MEEKVDHKDQEKTILNSEEDKIRLQVAIGLIAIYAGIFYLIQKYATYEGNVLNIYLAYIFYGFFVISNILFFLYIIFTGLHYKYKNKNYASDFYFPEKFRRFLYDFGLEMIVLGFLYSAIHAANNAIQKYFNFANKNTGLLIGLVGGGVVLMLIILFHQIFIDTEKKSK